MQNTSHKVVNCGTIYTYARCSQFGQLAHAFQKVVPKVLRHSKDLSSSTRFQMMTSHTFAYVLISILKMTVHLVLSPFISKTKAVRYQETMDLLLSLHEDIFSPK